MQSLTSPSIGAPAPDATVRTRDNQTTQLLELLGPNLTAFVFIRHSACIFCHEQVNDMRDHQAALANSGVSVVILTPDTPETVATFADKFQLPFPVLADPERNAYRAYAVPDGTFGQLMNARIMKLGFKAAFKGHFIKKPTAAPRQMPGAAIVDHDGTLRYLQEATDAADHLTAEQLIALGTTLTQ